MLSNTLAKPSSPVHQSNKRTRQEPPGSEAKRPRPSTASGPVTLYTRKAGARPPPTASMLGLVNGGRELWQRIAWLVQAPTYLGDQFRTAQAIGQALANLAHVHPELAKNLKALLRMARWSYELVRLFSPHPLIRPVDLDFLLCDPTAPAQGHPAEDRLQIPVPPLHTQRLEALLSAGRSAGATQDKRLLLEALFKAYLARLGPDPKVTTQATHLALLELPSRLITRDLTLHPHLQNHADLQHSPCSIQHPPLHALLASLPLLDPELRFLIVFSFSLAFGQWDGSLVADIRQHLQRHVPDAQALGARVMHWWESFLEAPEDQIDPQLTQEVLQTLLRAPVLGMEACMRLLSKLCHSPALRALATDEPLCTLIQRAMGEVDTEVSMVDFSRIEYLCSTFPEDLGLVAFGRLSPELRLAFVSQTKNLAILPYLQAVVMAEDIARELRWEALQDMIQRVRGTHAWRDALPRLLELQALMEQGGGPS